MDIGLDNLNNLTSILFLSTQKSTILRCSLVISIFMCTVIIFNCFAKLLKAFVYHEAIPKINQQRATNAFWHVIFSLVVLKYFINFSAIFDFNTSFKETLKQAVLKPQCNNYTLQTQKEQNILNDFGTLVLPITFFLHQLYASTSLHLEPDVFSTIVFCLFIYTSHTLSCPNLCFKVLSLLALDVGSMELARAIYALKSRQKGFKGPKAPLFLRVIAAPLFILHITAWSIINLYIFPILFLSLPSVSDVETSHRLATAYINIFLVILAKQRLFESPVWHLLKLLVTRPTDLKRMRSFLSLPIILLLPYSSKLLPELKAIQMDSLLNAIPTSAERRLMRKKILAANGQSSAPMTEEKADLLSIIKCVKVLKRKMRHRYEQRNGSEVVEDETPSSPSNSENEVTDIFIPVPQSAQQEDCAGKSNLEQLTNEDPDLESEDVECGSEVEEEDASEIEDSDATIEK